MIFKSSQDDHEIIRDKNFNIYRNDRTQASHPSDPNNPNKFRRFGGGVLIAIRSDIQADVKRLSVRKGAEILAIEVSINDKKFVFCTIKSLCFVLSIELEILTNQIMLA